MLLDRTSYQPRFKEIELPPARLAFLERQLASLDDATLRLRDRLLEIDGVGVALGRGSDPCAAQVLERGQLYSAADAIMRIGEEKRCHTNTALLVLRGVCDEIATGYALIGGVWTRHSWGVDSSGRVIETTAPWSLYYGCPMRDAEALAFADAQLTVA